MNSAAWGQAPGGSAWVRMLEQGCRGEGVVAHYQPIVDTAQASVVGYESLVRFPGHMVYSPDAWFLAAREHDRVADLEAASLRAALTRRDAMPPGTFLAVNLAPDVIGSPQVQEVLRAEPDLHGIVVELTEQARATSYTDLAPVLDRLRERGALIALDDAGTGPEGLAHVLAVKPAIVKLDRSLVAGLEHDTAKQALVEMMGTLSERLDARLLGEGVETAAELEALTRFGVPLAQGYFLGRPEAQLNDLDHDVALQLTTRVASQPAPGARIS